MSKTTGIPFFRGNLVDLDVNKVAFLSYLELYSGLMDLQQKNEGPTEITLNNWVLCDEWIKRYVEKRKREMKQDSVDMGKGKRREKVDITF